MSDEEETPKETPQAIIAKAVEENRDCLVMDFRHYNGAVESTTWDYLEWTRALQSLKDPSKWKVRKVIFSFSYGGAHEFSQNWDDMVQTVARTFASSLEEVAFMTGFWPSRILTNFLQLVGSNLKTLKFWDAGVYDEKEDLERFYQVLQGLSHLESCVFKGFKVLQGTDAEYMNCYDLTPFYAAIASLPVLTKATISIRGHPLEREKPRRNDFRSILTKKRLTSLHVYKVHPGDDNTMTDLANFLATPKSESGSNLTDLKIEFSWSYAALETNYYTGRLDDPTGPNWANLRHLAESIGAISGLQDLTIVLDQANHEISDEFYCTKLDDFLALVATELGRNSQQSSLQKLRVRNLPTFPDFNMDRKIVKAFVKLLEANTTLEKVDIMAEDFEYSIDETDMSLSKDFSMYLRLNQFGRKRMLENPCAIPVEEWADLFARLNDTACVNYYLSRFPWLVQAVGIDTTSSDED